MVAGKMLGMNERHLVIRSDILVAGYALLVAFYMLRFRIRNVLLSTLQACTNIRRTIRLTHSWTIGTTASSNNLIKQSHCERTISCSQFDRLENLRAPGNIHRYGYGLGDARIPRINDPPFALPKSLS
ncbi:hypothetical protein PLEOSDRAFT_1110094 [Pleurotus ostreatus PC15]|uniref:Uncharacterized protein n=1 Tax=Pleurotus ostreatus (strain PC15) TaxID=1137138 RepID=A0A067NDX6_PLEO1|nr:hypothetical protein PLEOSDRAFT_1110094 [Pleurotus ostreatus PC15]